MDPWPVILVNMTQQLSLSYFHFVLFWIHLYIYIYLSIFIFIFVFIPQNEVSLLCNLRKLALYYSTRGRCTNSCTGGIWLAHQDWGPSELAGSGEGLKEVVWPAPPPLGQLASFSEYHSNQSFQLFQLFWSLGFYIHRFNYYQFYIIIIDRISKRKINLNQRFYLLF